MARPRVASLALVLRPNPGLAVTAKDAQVAAGGATAVLVQASEPDVAYQLQAAGVALGRPQSGNGGSLSLPTGPLAASTLFSVIATRAGDARSTTPLAASVSVSVV